MDGTAVYNTEYHNLEASSDPLPAYNMAVAARHAAQYNIEVLMERAAKSEIRSLGTARNDVLASQQVRDLIIRSGFPLLDRDNKMDDVHIAAKATGRFKKTPFFCMRNSNDLGQCEVESNYFHNNILVESTMRHV